MFGRRKPSMPQEDPSVALVEALLDTAATRLAVTAPGGRRWPEAAYALWICACVTLEDAPNWLIYEDDDGRLGWARIPDGEASAVVADARLSAGGHADPRMVLAWLRGEAPHPWGRLGDGWGDDGVLEELVGRIRGSQP